MYGNLDWGKELSEDTEFLRVISHTNNFLWGAVLWSTLQIIFLFRSSQMEGEDKHQSKPFDPNI